MSPSSCLWRSVWILTPVNIYGFFKSFISHEFEYIQDNQIILIWKYKYMAWIRAVHGYDFWYPYPLMPMIHVPTGTYGYTQTKNLIWKNAFEYDRKRILFLTYCRVMSIFCEKDIYYYAIILFWFSRRGNILLVYIYIYIYDTHILYINTMLIFDNESEKYV